MNLLDDIFYYNSEHQCWKPSFIISIIKDKNRYLVAGYGPSLPAKKVLAEDTYIKLVDAKELEYYTLASHALK